MIIKHLKRICCIVFSCVLLGSMVQLNAFAWGTSTHSDLVEYACKILELDGKKDVVSFYSKRSAFSRLRYGAISPDWEEHIKGTHRYIFLCEPSQYGKYYKNTNLQYSISARTRFEEHYSTAINQYKNGNILGSFDSLGRAIHYLCDIGCPAHTGPLKGKGRHAKFETFGDKNCKKYMTGSAQKLYDFVLHSDFEAISNVLGKITSTYTSTVNEGTEASFSLALEKNIPLSQQYTAAILNRFYVEVNNPSTPYIKDNGTYFINITDTNKYLDSYYPALKVYKGVKNEYQQFKLRLNPNGSYHIFPEYDTSKALAVDDDNNVVLKDYSASDDAQMFKITYYPDGSTRIASAKSKYGYMFGKSSTKTITVQDFAPDNKEQRFTFTPV